MLSLPVSYTLEQVEKCFAMTFPPGRRQTLAEIPFSEETLKACAATHTLFPTLPIPLLYIAKHDNAWYAQEEQMFARTPLPVRWNLLRLDVVPHSLGMTWDDQRMLLSADEEVPSAALIAFACFLHYKATGKHLYRTCYVRTVDRVTNGNRVHVGYFDTDGFHVDIHREEDGQFGNLGLASCRKR